MTVQHILWVGIGWAALSGLLFVVWVLIAYQTPEPAHWDTEADEHTRQLREIAATPYLRKGAKAALQARGDGR